MRTQTNKIASLQMYDWPETSEALDNLWYLIQKKLNSSQVPSPKLLTRDDDFLSIWKNPHLLVSQTCGWPYANMLREHCVTFARFDHDIEDCPSGYYNCVYIGQSKKDIRFLENFEAFLSAKKIAINSDDSQSGFHVFKEITKAPSDKAIPKSHRVITGSHRNSIKTVAEGKARIAVIDAVCFELARRYDPDIVENVAVLGRSLPVPGLPLITSKMHRAIIPSLLEAIAFGVYNISEEDRKTLLIKGIVPSRDAEYDVFL